MNSFNHYAYGAVGKWMYATVAGLDYDEQNPGYKNIIFAPVIDGSLSYASTSHETPYGFAASGWMLSGSKLIWRIIIPANATGTIVFPTDKLDSVIMNGEKVSSKELKNVPSGTYEIMLDLR